MRVYAVEWTPYGRHASYNNGPPVRLVVSFPDRVTRDRWISERTTDYRNARGFREPVLRRNLTMIELHDARCDDSWERINEREEVWREDYGGSPNA